MTQTPPTPNPETSTEDQSHPEVDSFDIGPLLSRFHASMTVISLICLGIVYKQWGPDHLLPCLLGSALVWINMIALAYGIRGVFNQQKSLIVVLLLKFGLLIGGLFLLSSVFPGKETALLIGCSTWIFATLIVGQGGVKQNHSAMIFLLWFSLSASPSDARPTEADMLEGDVRVRVVDVKGSPMPKVTAEGIIKAKIQDLWGVIADCANYKNVLDNVMASEVLGMFKGKKRCEMVLDLPWPVSNLRSVVDVTLIKRPDGSRVRTWVLVEGDYHRNEGGWLLTPRPDGFTSVKYHVHVETKISLPDFVQRIAQKSKIPGLFENLRDALEKRGQLLP